MASVVTFNSVTYSVPAETDENWGSSLSSYLIAIASGSLQKSGGTFTLTAEASFGATYGLKSAYYKSLATNPSSAGILRLGNAEVIGWRNAANSADLSLTVNSSNQLTFNSVVLANTTGPSFQDSLFTIFDNGDITKILAFDCASITTGTTRTLTIPDASGNIVLPATTDTFTNKTFDAEGTGNALSNITNTHIKAAAAIALDKLAALTVSRLLVSDGSGFVSVSSVTSTEAGYLSGVTSAIQTQINAKSPAASPTFSGTITTPLTASRAVVTGASSELAASATTATELGYVNGVTSAIQTQLDAKVTAASAAITSALTMDEVAAPSTPASGKFAIYPKTDGKLYTLNDAGTETEVGAGGSSGINYIENPDFESDASGWSITKNTSASATPDNGFSASSTSNTIARSTSSPLRGVASGLYTLAALGNQLVKPFTIDSADKYKVLQCSFDYSIASGTYADDTVTVWIYDIANTRFRQPTPYLLKNHSLPSERMFFEFQCTDSTSYYLVLHQAAASTAALKIDNFIVGPQAKLYGSAVTDWVSYTPTTSWPSNTIVAGKWRKVGDSMEININIALTGVPTTADLTVNLPTGYSIDTSKFASSFFASVGSASILDSGTRLYVAEPVVASSTSLYLIHSESGNTGLVNQANPTTFTTNDNISILAKVPILGWSSSQIMSQDASTRVVKLKANRLTGQAISGASDVKVQFNGLEKDTHGAFDNVTNYRYTVKVPGEYEFDGMIATSPGATATIPITLYKNGSPFNTIAYLNASASVTTAANFKGADTAVAGDYYEIYVNPSSASNTILGANAIYGGSQLNIKMLQGPAQIAASEGIDARASGDPASASVGNPVIFPTADWSTHNAYSTSTGLFTCPISGKYEVSGYITSANATIGLKLAKDGATDVSIGVTDSNGEGYFRGVSRCLAGQTLSLEPDGTLDAASGSYIYFQRIGNY